MTQREIVQSVKIVILALLLTFGINAIHANWTAPQNLPPACVSTDPGCAAPINTSNTSQSKLGALLVGTASTPTAAALRIPFGQLLVGTMDPNSSYKINADGYINGGTASAGGLCIRGVCRDAWPTGGGGGITSSGSNGFVPLFNPNGQTLINSVISQSFSSVTIDGTLKITGGSPVNGRVLTTNSAGQASWQPSSLLCPVTGGGGTECQQAQQNNGLGNGTWRAVNCVHYQNGFVLSGGFLSYNSGTSRWQYYTNAWLDCRTDSSAGNNSVLIMRVGA